MALTDIFIKRPVFATALNLMLLMVGITAFFNLTIRQYPNIESNAITVTTLFPGASSELMAGFVTTPLENYIAQVSNIDYMKSTNTQGSSQIVIYLKNGTDITEALADIQSQVSQAAYKFPVGVQTPTVVKTDVNSSPTIFITFNSTKMTAEQLTDYLIRVIQPQFENLAGVQQINLYGRREFAMRLNLDPVLMAGYNVTANDIMDMLASQNVQSTAGRVSMAEQEYNVSAKTDINTVDEFNDLIIRKNGSSFIRLKDIGQASLGALNYRTFANVNGQQSVTLAVSPASNASPLLVSSEVEKLMPKIIEQLPKETSAFIVHDNSIFINASIKEVVKSIIEAIIFVVLVMFLFLGSLRTVIVPVVTIPLSIMGVCAVMLLLGYSINTITLLAWVLAIGLVVDDAIVVVENIHGQIQKGVTSFEGALIGSREIAFAVVAMTITLAAVYTPIGFTTGMIGMMFREFAFTLSAAVIVSGFIALTLSPMMCSRLLTAKEGRFAHAIDRIFEKVVAGYEKTLRQILNFRTSVLLSALLVFIFGIFVYKNMPVELAPSEDQGVIFTYSISPSSSNINYQVRYSKEIQSIFESIPEEQGYVLISGAGGVNTGFGRLRLTDWGDRERTAANIIAVLNKKLWNVTGLQVFAFSPPPLPSSGSMPLEIVLKTTGADATQRLFQATQTVLTEAKQYPGIARLDSDLKIDKPEVSVDINRNLAFDEGVSMKEIASALSILLGEPQANQFSMEDRSYYVIPSLDSNFKYENDPMAISKMYVRGNNDSLVPLANFIKISTVTKPQSINHFQQLTSATLSGTIAPGYTLGEVLNYLQQVVKEKLPADIQLDYSGQSRQMLESNNTMQVAFIFAILFIFLVLSAQFESFKDPFIVLMTVPLSLAGALFALNWANGTINIYSQIGLITLIGLISKHGILIVEFANQIREKTGVNKDEAVVQAACRRLRPILMTTAAMVLGSIPLALASGAGAEARHQLGWIIVGGMAIGTLFSLFVVPCVYSLMTGQRKQTVFANSL